MKNILDNEYVQVRLLKIEIEKTGHITNTYVIKDKDTNKILVIDPAFNENLILDEINKMQGNLESIIITHSHADHIGALAKLVDKTNAIVYLHSKDYEGLWNGKLNEEEIVGTKILPVNKDNVRLIEDKDSIKLGKMSFEIIHTPGHTIGSISILDMTNDLLYSGDTIFENTYGRTDLITGSHDMMKESIDKLFDRFENVTVLPGHGNIFNIADSKRKIRLIFAFKG